jgi:hypothetical protein
MPNRTKSGFPTSAGRASRVREGTGRSVSLGKAWIFLEQRSQQPTAAMRRPYLPTPCPKHTREAWQSVPPAGVAANKPAGKNWRKALRFKKKKKK